MSELEGSGMVETSERFPSDEGDGSDEGLVERLPNIAMKST